MRDVTDIYNTSTGKNHKTILKTVNSSTDVQQSKAKQIMAVMESSTFVILTYL